MALGQEFDFSGGIIYGEHRSEVVVVKGRWIDNYNIGSIIK